MCRHDHEHLTSWHLSKMLLSVTSYLLLASWIQGCGDQPDPPRLTSLTATPGSMTLALGQTMQIKVTGKFSDGTSRDVTDSLSWQNSSSKIATISQSGLVTSVAVGEAKLIAVKSGVSIAIPLIISKAALQAISISPLSPTIALGTSTQLVATGTYTDNTTQDITQSVKWYLEQPGIARVTAAGLVSSMAAGSTAITASMNDINASTQLTISPAALVAIVIRSQRNSIARGGSEQFAAIGAYTDGSTADLTNTVNWTSAPAGILSFNGTGLATAKAVGSVTVTATSGSVSGIGSFTISAAELVSIAINSTHRSFPLGSTQQVSAIGTFTDSSTQDLTNSVHWSSVSPGIVAMSDAGVATAKTVGTSRISATSNNISGSGDLVVSNAALVSLKIQSSRSSLPLGSTQQLSAIGTYTDSSTGDVTNTVHWVSASPSIVSISSSGLATAKATGAAGITASTNDLSGSGSLTVTAAALASINISPASPTVPVGSTQQLTALGVFTDGSSRSLSGAVTWTSSSPDIAAISGLGLVTAKSVGVVGMSAASGGITGSADLSISTAAITSIAISPANPTVPLGSMQQLSATGSYTDGSTQDVTQQVTWNVDNPNVAGIDPTGLTTGQQVGVTGIEATLSGLQGSGTITVQPLLSVGYFDATSGIDTTVRATNPATTGKDLCAMFYVFDQDQQMSECCGCVISKNALLTLSLNNDLLSNPLTGVKSTAGTIMLVPADNGSNSICDASAITPAGTAVAWSTHVQKTKTGQTAAVEDTFSSSPLNTTLSSSLQAQCAFIQQLGGGQGQCTCHNPQ